MTDREWVERAREGDQAAFQALVDHHREAVFRLAYLILGDPDDAEDAAQEAFIRAYDSLHRFDTTRTLRPWLLRIVSNVARNRRRSLGRYWSAVQRFIGQQMAMHDASSIEGLSIQQAEAHALWRAVQQLKRSEQDVIYLRFFLDLPVSETAQALNIAEGTVKSRLHRALKRLRSIIQVDFPVLWEEREALP